MNRLTDIHRVRTHLDRQRNLTNHVARMRANHAAAQDLAVAMGLRCIVKQQRGDAFVAPVCNSRICAVVNCSWELCG